MRASVSDSRRFRLQVLGVQLGMLVAIGAAWVYYTRPGGILPLLLPSPENVFRTVPRLLVDDVFWTSVAITGREVAGGLVIAVGGGLVVGLASGLSKRASNLVGPLLLWIQTIPIILFYPICLLIFGVGMESKIVFGGVYGFFPVAASAIVGASTVPSNYLNAARSLGATKRQLLTRIYMPAARPIIASGIKVGAALVIIGVLAGEVLGSVGGLGYEIVSAGAYADAPSLYAYIFLTMVMIWVINRFVLNRLDADGVAMGR